MARGHPDWGSIATTPGSELPTYIVQHGVYAGAGVNRWSPSLFNPAASGKVVKVRRVVTMVSCTGGVGTGDFRCRIWRTSTLGTGGAITPEPLDPSDPPAVTLAAETLSVAPIYGNVVADYPVFFERNTTIDLARITDLSQVVPLYQHPAAGQEKPIFMRPGQGLAIQFYPVFLDGHIYTMVFFTEEAG